jgi:MFS family permease
MSNFSSQIIQKQRNVFKGMKMRELITFRLHALYSAIDGICQGVLALNEFVFLKSLHPNTFQVSLLFQIMSLLLPFSIFIFGVLKRIKNVQTMLIVTAALTRLPLLLFLFFPTTAFDSPYQSWYIAGYLSILTLYFLANPVVLPILNLFTKNTYAPQRFGRLFSYSMSITQGFWLVATFIFGILQDRNPDNYRIVYPIIGLLGFIAIYLLTTIPYKRTLNDSVSEENIFDQIKNIFKQSIGILKTNVAYRQFQSSMFLYGMGFLMALPVVTIYLVNEFNLKYTEISFYKNLPIIISIITYPIFGKLMDERDPRKLAIFSFFFALLFYLLLALGGLLPAENEQFGLRMVWMILLAYIAYGFFNSSIGLVWGIGSSYFAPPKDAAQYHALHLSLTGIRGVIAPPLGVLLFNWLGFYGLFACCIGFEILAILTMRYSIKNNPFKRLND